LPRNEKENRGYNLGQGERREESTPESNGNKGGELKKKKSIEKERRNVDWTCAKKRP